MNHPYQVLGTSVPTMLGRRRLLDQVERHLLKPSPDHVQVVGPTLFGKSVLLNHLAARHRVGSTHYLTSAYVDLRHTPPATDADFRRRFADLIKQALVAVNSPVAEYLDPADANVHELLVLVFDELERANQRLLVVLDGFDHVLARTGLSRTLWDQLRSLGQKGSLRLVTGSRRPLRELCRTDASQSSDFWEIFYDTPVNVGAFDDADWDDLLAPFVNGSVDVDSSGRKEIVNWSGGVPVLTAAMLEHLADRCVRSAITKSEVDQGAQVMLEERRQLLGELWEDCSEEIRGDLAILAEKEVEGIHGNELPDRRRRTLEARGFARALGNRVRPSCRLMTRFAAQQASAVQDLRRLFGTTEGFQANVRSLLELRLAQVTSAALDKNLRGYVENAIRDLEPNPELALKWVRSIATRAFALIWEVELGQGFGLPQGWLTEWKHANVNWSDDRGSIPKGYGAQCNILRLATGTEKVRRLTRYVTKPTCLLLDHLQSVGDFGQHREDFPESTVTTGAAAAVVLAAIELIESLTRDLTKG